MKVKSQYHCLIAGLPDLMFEDVKFPVTLVHFKEELEHELTREDYNLLRLIFLPYDNGNLIDFLLKNEKEPSPLSNYTTDDFEEQVSRLHAILEQEPLLPQYMIDFIRDFEDEEKEIPEEAFERILSEGYYSYVSQVSNDFLRRWFEFELNARNILTALISKKHHRDLSEEIIGETSITHDLIASQKKSLEIMTDDDYLNSLLQLAEEEDFYQRERKVDLLKWDYLDEQTFFHYFTIEKVIGYLIKLLIVFRWKALDKETGREMFERLIHDLEYSYELSEEFSLNRK
jgi:hypothetical protein